MKHATSKRNVTEITVAARVSKETVKVSKKYQVVIPERLRLEAGIRPGDRMVAIVRNGILQ